MIIRVEKPNPDGLDEVFHAYQTLRAVSKYADLCPNPKSRFEQEAAEASVDEAIQMLEAWLVERVGERL